MIDHAPRASAGPELPAPDDLVLRLTGEITTKGRRTRLRFQRRLVDHLRDAVESAGEDCLVRPEWSRIYLRAGSAAFPSVARVFGVSSFSVVEAECPADLGEIVSVGRSTYGARVQGRRFAVRARRAGKHAFNSADVMRELGAALGSGATVDLSNPDISVHVEIRDDRALFYSERLEGARGLPLGAEARAVCLLSGGFDSAVAAWMMLRRGVALDYVFCNLGGDAYQRLVLEVAQSIASRWSYGTRPTLISLDFEPVVTELQRVFRPSYQQIGLKRVMYRTAAALAARLGADAIVTGEAVGQVSSQTLANLRAIDDSSPIPVLRPLVGMDKEEIIARSREIGTYELSARVREYCSISTGRPATAASPEAVLQEEEALDRGVLEDAIDSAGLFDLRGLDLARLAGDSVFSQDVPDGSVVLDTRPAEQYRTWHWPGAKNLDYGTLLSSFNRMDREKTYLLYCEVGLKSARVAELMQSAGYEAYSFLGGVRALRRRAMAPDRQPAEAKPSGRKPDRR